jgi:hypothetical protein
MASAGDISDTFSFWACFCFVKTAFLVIFVLKSELLTHLPAGLTATSASVTQQAKALTVNITGTPSEAATTALTISIPTTFLERGTALPVTANENATITVNAKPDGAVYIAGTMLGSSPLNTGKYWKYTKAGEESNAVQTLGTGSE